MNMDIQDYLVKGQMNPALLSRSIRYAIDRKRSVDALKESEARARQNLAELQNLYDTALVGLCVTDRNNRYLRINKRLADINGLPPEKIIGRTIREVIPRIADQVEEAFNRVFRTGEPVENVEVSGRTRAEPDRQRLLAGKLLPAQGRRRPRRGRQYGGAGDYRTQAGGDRAARERGTVPCARQCRIERDLAHGPGRPEPCSS